MPNEHLPLEAQDRIEALKQENERLQQRVNALTKAIHHALDALDDPIFVNNQLWLDPEQTLFHFLEFHLYDRVANGERPLLEIP